MAKKNKLLEPLHRTKNCLCGQPHDCKIATRVCEYKCAKNYYFEGPVHVVMIDKDRDYCVRMFKVAYYNYIYFAIGLVLAPIGIFIYNFHINHHVTFHVLTATIGTQLLFPCGILLRNNVSASTAAMTPNDRAFEHMIVQITGSVLTLLSVIFIMFLHDKEYGTFHATLGNFGLICNVCAVVFIFLLRGRRYVHIIMGMLTTTLYSMCFITSLFKNGFIKKVVHERLKTGFPFVLAFLVLVYMVGLLAVPILKLLDEYTKIELQPQPPLPTRGDCRALNKVFKSPHSPSIR